MKEKKQQQSRGRGREGEGRGNGAQPTHVFTPTHKEPSQTEPKSELSLSEQPPYMQISHMWLPLALLSPSLSLSPLPLSLSLLVYVCKIKLFKFNYCQFYLLLMRIIVKFAKFMNAVKETERQTGTATC